MHKYEFCIKTRDGQLIERLNIAGRSQEEAERKLRQIYHYCEVVRCNELLPGGKSGQIDSFDDIASLISK